MRLSFPIVSAMLIPALIAFPVFADPTPADTAVANELHVSAKAQNGGFSVTVTDESGAGVSDAAVAVRLPETGDTGTFPDGTHAAVAYTDGHGEAHIPVPAWSTGTGTVPVKITATKGAVRAGMLFEQNLVHDEPAQKVAAATPTPKAPPEQAPERAIVQPGHVRNTTAGPAPIAPAPEEPVVPMVSIIHGPTHDRLSGGSHKKWIMLAAVAGAGAGVAFALAARKSSSSSTNNSSSALSIGTPTVSVGAP